MKDESLNQNNQAEIEAALNKYAIGNPDDIIEHMLKSLDPDVASRMRSLWLQGGDDDKMIIILKGLLAQL